MGSGAAFVYLDMLVLLCYTAIDPQQTNVRVKVNAFDSNGEV